MTIYLDVLRSRLLLRSRTLDQAFDRHVFGRTQLYRVDRYAVQEGLISALWQSWSNFCREVVFASARGAITSGGVTTTSPYDTLTDLQLGHIARSFARNEPPRPGRSLRGQFQEPTWGDLDALNRIVTGATCSNSSSICSALALGSAIRDLQLCRNANAHICRETILGVRSTAVRYSAGPLRHPSDLMFWVEPASGSFVWKSWIDEVDLISSHAVR